MKTQPVVVSLCAIAFGFLVLPAHGDEKAEALLKKVGTTLKATRTLTADFSRTYLGGTVFNGTVRLMKPNFARIEWTDSKPAAAPIYAACDGKTLWRYPYITTRQCVTEKADPTGTGTVPWMDGVPIQAFFTPQAVFSPEKTKQIKYQGRRQWEGAEYQVLEETDDGDGDPDRGFTCQLFIGKDYLIHRYLGTFHRKKKDGRKMSIV